MKKVRLILNQAKVVHFMSPISASYTLCGEWAASSTQSTQSKVTCSDCKKVVAECKKIDEKAVYHKSN